MPEWRAVPDVLFAFWIHDGNTQPFNGFRSGGMGPHGFLEVYLSPPTKVHWNNDEDKQGEFNRQSCKGLACMYKMFKEF